MALMSVLGVEDELKVNRESRQKGDGHAKKPRHFWRQE